MKRSRRHWIIGMVVVIALLVGATTTIWFTPAYREKAEKALAVLQDSFNTYCGYAKVPKAAAYGVDVSHYQWIIDWEKMDTLRFEESGKQTKDGKKGVKIGFAYAKATEGCDYTDNQYAKNRGNAKKTDILFGAYHVLRMSDAKTQIKHFIATAQLEKGDLVPMIDLEETSFKGVSNAQIQKQLREVCKEIDAHYGCKCIIYGSRNMIGKVKDEPAIAGHPLWVANPGGRCPKGATIHQFAWNGRMDGIGWWGRVDLNAIYKRGQLETLRIK